MTLRLRFFLAAFAVLLLDVAPAPAQVRVVATFSVVADLAARVGGPDAEVRALVGPDADSHVYEPTPADARTLAAAQLVVVNGLGFEGWLDRLVQAAGYRGPVVIASEGAPVRSMAAHAHAHAGHGHSHGPSRGGDPVPDPHAWHDPAKARIYVRNIAEGLARVDPRNAAAHRARGAELDARLVALEDWARARLAAIPAERRRVITSHDAFGHFADAFGFTVLAPVGFSTESEPTARGLARLIGQIRREGVRVVFLENMSDPRVIERIARETGAAIGGRLYADALSPPGGPADSHERMIRHNVETLAAALTRP